MIGTRRSDYITNVISSFTRNNEALVKSLLQIQYYYRGAFTRDDLWAMSHLERELAVEFLNKRFEEAGTMMKNQIPVFL